jgi:hypothetical protein
MHVKQAELISSRYICNLIKNIVQVTNFNFSPEEEAAICERDFFLLKNSATKKIMDIFAQLEKNIIKGIKNYPIELTDLNKSKGKIFRGENYRLFPYILLDCPRLFSTRSVFAFRTMFWWGHEFSFTLHLQGEALDKYRNAAFKNFDSLSDKEVYYCINDTPWQYNFEKENYVLSDNIESRREELLTKPFIKLSRKLNADSHQKVLDYGMDTFKLFMGLIDL